MRTQPQKLVQKLNSQTKKFLEHAIGKTVSMHHSEVLVEHLLLTLLEHEQSDVFLISKHFELNPFQLINTIERILVPLSNDSSARSSNSKIILSESLLKLIEDAWLTASVERNEPQVRSGHLFLQLLSSPYRYLLEDLNALSSISDKSLSKQLATITSNSLESAHGSSSITANTSSNTQTSSTASLQSYGENFTEKARNQKIDPIFGRYQEVQQVIHILARRRKNNPILVGDPGVGKTALVEGLALAIAAKQVPEELQNVELIGLDLGLLQAGASVKGEFERRLKNIIQEVQQSAKPIVLFMDEAHMLMGAGGAQGTNDAANLLKPSLARGELRTIAATTWAEYKKYFEKDPALSRRFQPVKVNEPSAESALSMIRGLSPLYEKKHGVVIRDEAMEAAVHLSKRFLIGRKLPDKAIDVIDTAAARVRVSWHCEPEPIALLNEKIASYHRNLSSLRRDFEETKDHTFEKPIEFTEKEIEYLERKKTKLKTKWSIQKQKLDDLLKTRNQLQQATQILENEDAHPSDQNADQDALMTEFNQAYAQWKKSFDQTPMAFPEVTAEVVAQTLSDWTGIPVGKIQRETLQTVLTLETQLSKKIIGQDQALKTLSKQIRNSYSHIKKPESPVGVFLFVGTSGVGKTETARTLADFLFGGEKFLTTINMTEFQEKHTVSRLIGSPPGYVGFGEGGILTEAIRQNPHSIVLLDECEKAHIEVMNLFYQVFDRGILSDGEGQQIDCKNTLFIMTSNLASEQIQHLCEEDETISQQQLISQIENTLAKHFQPALLGRMTTIPFVPLKSKDLATILLIKLEQIKSRVEKAHQTAIHFSDTLIQKLLKECSFGHLGARNMEHAIERFVLPDLSSFLLEKNLSQETIPEIEVSLDASEHIQIKETSPKNLNDLPNDISP